MCDYSKEWGNFSGKRQHVLSSVMASQAGAGPAVAAAGQAGSSSIVMGCSLLIIKTWKFKVIYW